jgi:hypothetical protein
MKKLALILSFLTFFTTAFAGESQRKKTTGVLNQTWRASERTLSGQSAESSEVKSLAEPKMMERCKEMMEQKQKMMEDMKAQDDQLTDQLSKMNAAPEDKKTDLMAALLTQMVEKRIAMDARKAKMEEEMMQHTMQHMQMGKGSMSQCPMMKGMKGMEGMKGMDAKPADTHKEHQQGAK